MVMKVIKIVARPCTGTKNSNFRYKSHVARSLLNSVQINFFFLFFFFFFFSLSPQFTYEVYLIANEVF